MCKWISVEDELPRDKCVLVAIDSYDCGWVIDSAWYDHNAKQWMITGCLTSQKAHMPYTHWMNHPKPPETEE